LLNGPFPSILQADSFFAAARTADVDTVGASAHRLRGVGAQLQAERFVVRAQELEDAAELGDADAVRVLIDGVEAAFAAVRPQLDEFARRGNPS
jgi:hypothetical protein